MQKILTKDLAAILDKIAWDEEGFNFDTELAVHTLYKLGLLNEDRVAVFRDNDPMNPDYKGKANEVL